MTQSQFMYDLTVALDGVPDEEKYVLTNDYDRYFSDRLSEGMSEELITQNLSSPAEIARRYKQGDPIPIDGVDSVFVSQKKGKITFLSVCKFILMIPLCIVYEIISVFFGIVLFLISLMLCVGGALFSVAAFMSMSLNIGFLLLGIGGIFLTVSFVMLSGFVILAAVKAVRFLPGKMSVILNNKSGARGRH